VEQARGEAPQSGHEVTSPEPHRNPSSTPPADLKAELRHWFFQKLNPEQRTGFLVAAGIAPKTCDLTLGMQYQAIERIAEALAARSNQEATPFHRSKEWWLAKARAEPDGPCTVGVPDDRDALWSCQQLAASGIEATNDTGPLADIFAEIHRTAAGQLASKEPPVNTVQEATRTVGDAELALRNAEDNFRAISNWRKDCHAHDADMGHELRDFDDEDWEMVETYARRAAARVGDALSHTSSSGGK
jgi:hypothetical protein